MKNLTGNITDSDIDNDFEYNFDLYPFNSLLFGLHGLIAATYSHSRNLLDTLSVRVSDTRNDLRYRRTFKGPVCMLK